MLEHSPARRLSGQLAGWASWRDDLTF